MVNATFSEETNALLDFSSYEYVSTNASNEKGDEIKLSFSGQESKQFLKVTKDSRYPFFKILIDRNLITKNDAGSFSLTIEASDS